MVLFVDYSFYSLVQENKRTFKVLKRDLKLKCIHTRENYLIVLRKVEGSRGVGREMRGGKILKEVPLWAIIWLRRAWGLGSEGRGERIAGGCPWGS